MKDVNANLMKSPFIVISLKKLSNYWKCLSRLKKNHIEEECLYNNRIVKCQNFGKGCEWKGLMKLRKNHIKEECSYQIEICMYCNDILRACGALFRSTMLLMFLLLMFFVSTYAWKCWNCTLFQVFNLVQILLQKHK